MQAFLLFVRTVLPITLAIAAGNAWACDPASTLRDMRDADAGTRIRGIQCVASLKQPSVEIVLRLVELFSDQTRGPRRGIGLLDGMLLGSMFPGSREYSEQVDYHANEASDRVPLDPQYIGPFLQRPGRVPFVQHAAHGGDGGTPD